MSEFTANLPQDNTHVRFRRVVWHEKKPGASQGGGETSRNDVEEDHSHFSHSTNIPRSPKSRIQHPPTSQSPNHRPVIFSLRTTSTLGKQHPESAPKPRAGGGWGRARSLSALSAPRAIISPPSYDPAWSSISTLPSILLQSPKAKIQLHHEARVQTFMVTEQRRRLLAGLMRVAAVQKCDEQWMA
ncbi:hypothetical protein FIBSPDRAFT_1052381 [Athelia psychrophila]|uniref:Uncharacterized protein n=1 Tax=Athelia psychrophila TaxID=1759441 RepID=A0A165XF12_9AGAM|nr:hypothetical protein FIBSPDRAFT_1052381 [Fibularhizoctonia sp. CBS 109695]